MDSQKHAQNGVTDALFVRGLLWEIFPDWRHSVIALEEEEREVSMPSGTNPSVGSYGFTSEIFVWGILASLFGDDEIDTDLARRCAVFIERLLDSGRPAIAEMVSIRITDYLLGYPENWKEFQSYAGDLLHQEVDSRRPYYRDF